MSRINSNVPALRAIHQLSVNNTDLNLRLERLATGLRINRGADDPAGLIASEGLRNEIRSIGQAIDNSARAINVIATAEGALNEVSALLLELQDLLVASANDGGLTADEIHANQLEIDSLLSSIDRIANTTTFAGEKLLDGSRAYTVSSLVNTQIATLSVFAAQIPQGGTRDVTVRVTASAQTAQVALIGANTSGASTTSATTIEIRGTIGSDLFSFTAGTSLSVVRDAINSVTLATGVSAILSTPGTAGIASALLLNSTEFGSDAFVSVTPISGNFIVNGNSGTESRDIGQDTGVVVNGQLAAVKGLRADVRSTSLDARLYLTASFAQQTTATASFQITGGGATFQLAPEVTPNGQVHIGFSRVASTALGDRITGLLYTLRSGQGNDLASKNFLTAQKILAESIDQVSSFRGRLGNFQRNKLETNIRAQSIALENVTAAESLIRDADIAVEVAGLTRAQILVQSTQATLQIATSAPRQVLALLG